jgi:hypothetical protein
MTQILKFSRNVPSMWSNLTHVVTRTPARHHEFRLPNGPQLYRSEAVGEDLAELYPMLSLDLEQPRRRQPRSAGRITLLAAAWVTSLVLATVVAIHTTLA